MYLGGHREAPEGGLFASGVCHKCPVTYKAGGIAFFCHAMTKM